MEKIKTSEFNSKIENGYVVVDFFTTWCGPCKMMAPILEKIASTMPNINFYKVDVEEEPKLGSDFKIKVVPTVMLFKNGQMVTEFSGFKPEAAVVKLLKETFNV
ncbi:MAG: thioredoxin [Mycoplasma sp.]